MRSAIATASLFACLVACGRAQLAPDLGDGGSPGLTLGRLPELAAAYCEAAFRCCKAGDSAWKTRADCEIELSGKMRDLQDEIASTQTAGLATYDGRKAATCVSRLKSSSCADLAALLQGQVETEATGCPRVTTGEVKQGETCLLDGVCADGLHCDRSRCQPLPSWGQACTEGDCADGLYCQPAISGDHCAMLKTNGEACDGDDQCASRSCVENPRTLHAICGPPQTCVGS